MGARESVEPQGWMFHLESERSLLGALMMDNTAYDRIVDLVSAVDFYIDGHRLIFQAVAQQLDAGKAADIVTLSEQLGRTQGERFAALGGLVYLGDLCSSTASSANVRRYAEIVRERAVLRALMKVAMRIGEDVANPAGRSAKDLLDAAQEAVCAVGERAQGGSELITLDQVMADVLGFVDTQHRRYVEGNTSITGLTTGFRDIDAQLSGLQPGQLVILAARPAMGKSALALNMAEHGSRLAGKTALVFSLEMGVRELGLRLLASAAQVNVRRLVEGRVYDEEWPRVSNSVAQLNTARIAFSENASLGIAELRAVARRAVREQGGLSMIVIDYLQLMVAAESEANRANQISEITRGLKLLAKELQVPVLALSQLNRGVESRQNKRPVPSDLRDSGSIEQDADVILFIYRDEVYNPGTPDKGVAEVIISKQRNGPTGTVHLAFRADQTRFIDLDQAYHHKHSEVAP